MGWTPSQVRAATLADVFAALSGWLRAQGVEDAEALSGEDRADLVELMERYS